MKTYRPALLSAVLLMLASGPSAYAQPHSTYISELNALKDKFNVTFVYDSSLRLDGACRSVRSRSSLTRSMQDLLAGSGMEYEIQGGTVILRRTRSSMPAVGEPAELILDTLRPARIEAVMRDTLRAARIISGRVARRDAGTRIVALPELSTMVAATGEADAIKYIQTLPGVSTGAEGSSAIYVRGGNVGNNLTTLDGIPLYGGSHLLGLTSAYPTDIVSSVSFRVGGFHGDESNVTASHIDLSTKDGDFSKPSYSLSASTFILGGAVSVPVVKDRLSFLGSVRVSPLGPAFRAVQSAAGGALDSLSRPRAVVYDAYAKLKWLLNDNHALSFSIFNSLDAYSYIYGGDSEESMGWNNLIASARHEGMLHNGWTMENSLSYNRFNNRQGIYRDMSGTLNNLAIVSSLDEVTADMAVSRTTAKAGEIRLGARERFTFFNPGTSSTFSGSGPLKPLDSTRSDHKRRVNIVTLHAQWSLSKENRYEFMASGRINSYTALGPADPKGQWFNPEAGLMARINLAEWLAVEATGDWLTQYYHTLEGIPLGWSVDLIVPASLNCPPERARQFYAGLFTSFGQHRFTAGAYDKRMSDLVYFLDAGMLFSPATAGWNNNIKTGTGTSRGIELLYEKDGARLDCRVAYTLSKTNRTFIGVNDGQPFPAKFDRRHILNATASFIMLENSRRSISMTGLFTYQSGHWETVAAGEYGAYTLFGKELTLDYFTSVNNFEMPSYMRLDLGCSFDFKTRNPQTLNIGVYNVLNRHNPLTVIYDDRSREWRQVSLLPIMPSFSYRITF